MTAIYKYSPLEAAPLPTPPTSVDWWTYIPNPKINGQIKPEAGTRFGGPPGAPPRFRLITLLPGNGLEPVVIQLATYHLDNAPEYEALSYVWGDTAKIHQITCNGLLMMVNNNVNLALCRLREPASTRVLWIDALCINQEDNDEKSNQIKLMGQVYAKARQAPIWPGEEAASDTDAFMAIQAIYDLRNQRSTTGIKEKPTVDEINALPSFPKNGWDHIKSLLTRPWFTRLWVIQEAVKAKDAVLLLGNKTLPYSHLGTVALGLPIIAIEDLIGVAQLCSTMLIQSCISMEKRGLNTLSIFDLMLSTGTMDTSEPRDRLYSLLNLPLVEMEWVPLPNYNLSPMEVFRDFAILDLLHNNSMRAISWAGLQNLDELPDSVFPSWTPNIAKKNSASISATAYFQKKRAGGSLPIEAKVYGKSILTLLGRRAGSITLLGQSRKHHYAQAGVSQPQRPADFSESALAVERTWINESHRMLARCYGSTFSNVSSLLMSDLYKEFVRASCLDWDSIHQRKPTDAAIVELRTAIFQAKALEAGPIEGVWDKYKLYRRCLAQGVAFGSRLCFLEDGKMGWVPGGAKEEDVVFVFNGGVVPYLLRPQPDGTFWWVGECWIQDIMDGEMLRCGVEPKRVRIR